MKGFTLIELLVTASIVAVLASLAVLNFEQFREKAKYSQAQVELKTIYFAVIALENDTGQLPGGSSASGVCVVNVANNEFGVNDCRAGLACTDGSFNNWRGPYLQGTQLTDPWGTPYQYDQDYLCNRNVNGCSKHNVWAKVVATAGPDKVINNYDSQESVLVFCY